MIGAEFLKALQQSIRRTPAIHKLIRSVWTPPQTLFQHLYFDGVFIVEVEPGVSFLLESRGEQIENDLFWRGYGKGWEGESLSYWRDLAKTARVIVDVGANTGVFALAAKAVNPNARVIAIEPSQRVAARLRRNIELNGFNIEVIECAASDADGNATLYDHPGNHQYSASLEISMEGTVPVRVQTKRLDDVLDRADLVKIDVERHEPATLRGMKHLLEQWHPTILIEVLDDDARRLIQRELPGDDYCWTMIEADRNALLCAQEGTLPKRSSE
jgi:FkbM family methyltransferase